MRFKLIISFLILFLGLLPCNAQEYSRLYLIKNAQKENLDNFTQMYLREYNYKFLKNDGYLITAQDKNGTDYSSQIIQIKQIGSDCYFYYTTANKNADILENLLKRFKVNGLKTKRIKQSELLAVFSQDAALVKSNALVNSSRKELPKKNKSPVKYDFSDDAQAAFDAEMLKYQGLKANGKHLFSENKNVKSSLVQNDTVRGDVTVKPQNSTPQITEVDVFNNTASPLKGSVVYIPKGEQLEATLQSSISSGSVAKNDSITAILSTDWRYKGLLIAPSGSILYGKAVNAKKAGYAYSNGEINIMFTELLTSDGQRMQLPSNNVLLSTGINRSVKIAANVIGGAIIGVASGALYTLISGGNIVTGLAVGAGIGGFGGTVSSVAHKGENVEIPAGTNFKIKFMEAINVSPVYK